MSVEDLAVAKALYRVRNWSDYNQSLVDRGNITIWFDAASIKTWASAKIRGGRGRPEEFSDSAIECCLVIRSIFRLPLRGTQGFVEGMIHLLGLDLEAPHYTLLCKRASELKTDLKALPTRGELHIVIDSTGLKIYGEGEWRMRCYGKSKRRSWRKLHLAVNPVTHEIVGCELTDHTTHDCEVIDLALPRQQLGNVCADGAYDNQKSYDAIVSRGGTPFIPPRSGACKTRPPTPGMTQRNHTVAACWAIGRDAWKKGTPYHQRSLAETAMFRFKTICGAQMSSRKTANQRTESRIKSQIINRMTQCGMPRSHKVS
jgi:IS5 family transposase